MENLGSFKRWAEDTNESVLYDSHGKIVIEVVCGRDSNNMNSCHLPNMMNVVDVLVKDLRLKRSLHW